MTGFDGIKERLASWDPPGWRRRIRFVDAHAAGEPLRVILDGFDDLEGEATLDLRRDARKRLDWLRRSLMWEPRGHADMYGCVILPPVTPRADLAVLFMHNEGFSTMCGHGIIAVATALVETGAFPEGGASAIGNEVVLGIDTPAGFVEARATLRQGSASVDRVAFVNVPSFALALDREVTLPTYGTVRFDLAFGGAFYAYVDADELGIALDPGNVDEIKRAGRSIKRKVATAHSVTHPEDADLGFLYGTVFTARDRSDPALTHGRHVCVFADGEVDRSPTGTGVAGRLALLWARGVIGPGEEVRIGGIASESFGGRVLDTLVVGEREAVVPEVSGTAHITGRGEFLIDPSDPLRHGFLMR